MPGLTTEPVFQLINVKELHPTFGAEISGVDFSKPVEDDVFQEILAAITKVTLLSLFRISLHFLFGQSK
jgi:alpha-ketoglutarate-dependent 2,4-dichlorophenoxyacetate dioxygenase